MSHAALRPLLLSILSVAGFSVLASNVACTLIVNPRDDVQRCGSSDDCEATGDQRYIAECRFDAGSTVDSTEVDKICVAAYKPAGCNPDSFVGQNGEDHPLVARIEEAERSMRYVCAEESLGLRGCPPSPGVGCGEGLAVNDFGLCDSDDGLSPAFASTSIEADVPQDVLDQFCKSFYCEDDFVCDTETFSCVRCDPDEMPGQGGCGTVFVQGQPSCEYLLGDALEDQCAAEDASLSDPDFGNCG